MITSLLKRQAAYQTFAKDAAANTLSHAYLVLSEDARVRAAMQSLIASLLFCPQGGDDGCVICQKLENESLVDQKVFNQDGKMRVSDAKTLIEDAYIKPFECERKAFFLLEADELSPAVQNKLLKIYEEPPAGVHLVMLAKSTNGILPTILSRAKKVQMARLAAEDIREVLVQSGVAESLAQAASVFASGRLDRALQFSGDAQFVARYEDAFDVLLTCKRSSDVAKFLSRECFLKENMAYTLDFIEIILRDVVEYKVGGNAYLTLEKDYLIEQIASGFTAHGAAMAILALNQARAKLKSNVGIVTVAESMLFDILEAKYKWNI